MNAHVPPHRISGELATALEWESVAVMLDEIAWQTEGRFRVGQFNRALAGFIAKEVRQAAAEIRANVALEELSLSQNLP